MPLTFNVGNDFVSLGLPLVEVQPATLVATFRKTFAAAPTDSQYIAPGHFTVCTALTSLWMLYTRNVMYAVITNDGDVGGSLIIETGSDNLDLVNVDPVMHDWIPIYIPRGRLPMVITGLELPGLIARFRLQTSSSGVAVFHGSIIMKAV